jgi:hypothetical protein
MAAIVKASKHDAEKTGRKFCHCHWANIKVCNKKNIFMESCLLPLSALNIKTHVHGQSKIPFQVMENIEFIWLHIAAKQEIWLLKS